MKTDWIIFDEHTGPLIFDPLLANYGVLTVSAGDKTVLTIEGDGKVVWHHPELGDDAADLLLQHVNISLERKAGIQYSRDEWENDIKAELERISNSKTLTPDVIDEVFKKHKMLSRLQGKI